MKLREIPKGYLECLAIFEAFRRLGYPADKIFFVCFSDAVVMSLRHEGLEFAVRVDDFDGHQATCEEIVETWNRAAVAWNGELTESDRLDIWDNSKVKKSATAFVVLMQTAGFEIPMRVTN